MTASEIGAYFLLLLNSIEQNRSGYLPNDMQLLRKISRLPNSSWKQSMQKLLKMFTYSSKNDAYFNETMLNTIEKKDRISEKRRQAGMMRKKENKTPQTKNKSLKEIIKAPVKKLIPEVKSSIQNIMLEVHEIQEYVDKYFVNIKKIENQLTYKQCVMLRNQFSLELIAAKLKKMENTKDIHTRFTTIFITLEEWCKKEVTGKT